MTSFLSPLQTLDLSKAFSSEAGAGPLTSHWRSLPHPDSGRLFESICTSAWPQQYVYSCVYIESCLIDILSVLDIWMICLRYILVIYLSSKRSPCLSSSHGAVCLSDSGWHYAIKIALLPLYSTIFVFQPGGVWDMRFRRGREHGFHTNSLSKRWIGGELV